MKLMLIVMVLALLPTVTAYDALVGENTTVWADIINVSTFVNTQANITIQYPNGTVAVNNEAMQTQGTGRFSYTFMPTQSGIYYTFTNYIQSGAVIGLASSTFSVGYGEQETMIGIGVLLSLIAGILFFGFMAFYVEKGNAVWKVLSLIMMMLLLVLVAKTGIDSNQVCAVTSAGLTCHTAPATGGEVYYRIMLTVMFLFFAYVIVSLFIQAVDYMRKFNKI